MTRPRKRRKWSRNIYISIFYTQSQTKRPTATHTLHTKSTRRSAFFLLELVLEVLLELEVVLELEEEEQAASDFFAADEVEVEASLEAVEVEASFDFFAADEDDFFLEEEDEEALD